MAEKIPVKLPAVAIEKMITLKQNDQSAIVLPAEFIENLESKDPKERWAVVIFVPATKLIRIKPTKSPMVIKVFIEYGQVEGGELQALGVVLLRNNIKTLYGTGPGCFNRSIPPHPFEGYFYPYEVPISEEELKSELLVLPNVTNVELTQCSL